MLVLQDKKRQKLDSGIGEGTASSSTGSTPASHSPEESDGRPHAEVSPADNQNGKYLGCAKSFCICNESF